MNFVYRTIQHSDIENVIELLQEISDYRPEYKIYELIRNEIISSSSFIGLVAVYESGSRSEIVGFGSLCMVRRMRGGRVGYIEDVIVSKKYRGMTVGAHMVLSLINLANSEGCFKITLECRENNVGFYNKIGFVSTGHSMSMMLNKS